MILGYDPDDPFLQPPEREVLRAVLLPVGELSQEPVSLEERRFKERGAQMLLHTGEWVREKEYAKRIEKRERRTRFGRTFGDRTLPPLCFAAIVALIHLGEPIGWALAFLVAGFQGIYWTSRVRERADAIAPEHNPRAATG